MATQLSRTFGSQGNQRKFTISTWVKRNKLGTSQSIFGSGGSGAYATNMYFHSSDKLYFWNYFNSAYAGVKYSNASYKDTSAWYHIVFRVDTTSATASERMRVYVNGEEISYSSSTDPSQNQTMEIGHTGTHYIGGYGEGAQAEMCMSHFHYCDGQSYAPTEFGEYDTNGVWKIKVEPSVSYGVSGHFLFNNDASVTDQSGLGNNWSVNSGTLTQTEDNPSNVFCVLNPLSHLKGWSITNGNTRFQGGTVTDWQSAVGATLGASSGKYYWEVKWVTGDSYSILGVLPIDQYWRCNKGDTTTDVYEKANCVQLSTSGTGSKRNYVSADGNGTQRSLNDILMFAIDMDNKKMWLGENGVWDNSGNPATGANPTWDTTEFNSDWDSGFVPYCQSYQISAQTEFHFNFGNGYFGTTAVASAGTNASGIGIFEYDVPTGYTALSTRGLNL